MQKKPIVTLIYHSTHGHTEHVAKLLAEFLAAEELVVNLLAVGQVKENWEQLHISDAIIFGTPTYFGNVSARFKEFMEWTGAFWYKQLWKDKFAAAFTVSSSVCGDKSNTLQSLALFGAQHSMLWISLGVLPRYLNDQQTEGQNRLASYLGLMIQSDNSQDRVDALHPGDVLTTELFAKRIAKTLKSADNLNHNINDAFRNRTIPR